MTRIKQSARPTYTIRDGRNQNATPTDTYSFHTSDQHAVILQL